MSKSTLTHSPPEEADILPTEPGWYRVACPNPWGDEVVPVRTYWIGRDLMVDLPTAGPAKRTRKVSAVDGWKGKLDL